MYSLDYVAEEQGPINPQAPEYVNKRQGNDGVVGRV